MSAYRIGRGFAALLIAMGLVATIPAGSGASQAGEADEDHDRSSYERTARDGDEAPTATGPASNAEALLAVTDEASYRAALLTASGNAEPDTISIQSDFTVSSPPDPTHTGADALTIEGNGFTVDSAVLDVLFLANDTVAPLTIQNLTVEGFTTTTLGGAVFSEGDVTVTGSTFTGNEAEGPGGGVFTAGDATITDSTFADNASLDSDGGAVTSVGLLTIVRSTFTGNEADEYGGAVAAVAGVVATDASFVENVAHDEDGGAIDAIVGPVTVTRSRFVRNVAEDEGGAIVAEGDDDSGTGTVLATASQFIDNAALDDDGGAIDGQDGVTAIDSTFDGNESANDGGAIDTSGFPSVVRLVGSTLTGNTAADEGGGISAEDSVVAINSTITDNTAVGDDGDIDGGGGIDVQLGDITLVYVTMAGNSAQDAGANVFTDPDGPGGDLITFGSSFSDPQGGGGNCSIEGTTVSGGYNRSTDDTCGLTGAGDVEDADDPNLAALADNGGPTPTRLPLTGSPLIDAIPEGACDPQEVVDQRDVTRPQDGDGDGTPACDIGAVEVEADLDDAAPPTTPISASPTFTG